MASAPPPSCSSSLLSLTAAVTKVLLGGSGSGSGNKGSGASAGAGAGVGNNGGDSVGDGDGWLPVPPLVHLIIAYAKPRAPVFVPLPTHAQNKTITTTLAGDGSHESKDSTHGSASGFGDPRSLCVSIDASEVWVVDSTTQCGSALRLIATGDRKCLSLFPSFLLQYWYY